MVWPSLPSASRTPSPSQAETLFPLNPPSPEPSFPSPPQPPSTCFLCDCDSLSSLYQWNHTAHAFLCLLYVTEHHVLRGHPHVVCVTIASLFIAKECPFVPTDHALFIRRLTTVNNAAVSSAFFGHNRPQLMGCPEVGGKGWVWPLGHGSLPLLANIIIPDHVLCSSLGLSVSPWGHSHPEERLWVEWPRAESWPHLRGAPAVHTVPRATSLRPFSPTPAVSSPQSPASGSFQALLWTHHPL